MKDKEFVDYHVYGRQHEYFPLVSKEQYSGKTMKSLVKNYFKGSYKSAVSFLVEKNEMTVEDLEMLLDELKKERLRPMEAILLYFGKTILCSGVTFLYYQLSLKDKTFHHYNRFYLFRCHCDITFVATHQNR